MKSEDMIVAASGRVLATGKPAVVGITPVDETTDSAEPEIAPSGKASERQRVPRLQGRPISAIFQKAQDQPPPTAQQPDSPPEPRGKPGKRVVSKLFDQPEQK
jgi:hypothetical protein